MSPEVDLLETLAAQNELLIVALRLFGGEKSESGFERARRVIQLHADSGVIQLRRVTAQGEQVVPNWEVRIVLADKENWLNITQEPIYWLSLAGKGDQLFLKDSEGFFK